MQQNFGDLTLSDNEINVTWNFFSQLEVYLRVDIIQSVNTIDFVTISTTGDAVDFGDLTYRRR